MAKRSFTDKWWGQAWIDALERRAHLDPNRLPRGRTYARTGRVRSVELVPGEIRAVVQGSRPAPYSVRVGIRQLDDGEWSRLLDTIASRASHAAALLDGDLAPGIVEDAEQANVALLPGPGELSPRCSCPDYADPCKHSAASVYLVARELDLDPFSLLLLRGRTREQVLSGLRSRRAKQANRGAGATDVDADQGADPIGRAADPGITARNAWDRTLADLPTAPHWREQPGRPVRVSVEVPQHLGFTAASLYDLADDSARRAWHALRGEGTIGMDADATADLARRAASVLDTPAFLPLADAAGMRPRDLMADALAWQQAGDAGVRMLQEPAWIPPVAQMVAGRDVVVASGATPSQVRVRNNTISIAGRTQIRLSRDGLWYRLDKRGGRWELTAPAAEEPDDLVFVRQDNDPDED